MTTEPAALTQARREYLRLDRKASEIRDLLATFGGSPDMIAYSADLTQRARVAYAACRAATS